MVRLWKVEVEGLWRKKKINKIRAKKNDSTSNLPAWVTVFVLRKQRPSREVIQLSLLYCTQEKIQSHCFPELLTHLKILYINMTHHAMPHTHSITLQSDRRNAKLSGLGGRTHALGPRSTQ